MNQSKSSLLGTSTKLALAAGISLLAAGASQASVMHFELRAVPQTADAAISTTAGVSIDANGNASLSSAIAGTGAQIVFQLSVIFEGGNLTGKIGVAQGAIASFGSTGRLLTAGAGGIVGRTIANFNNTGSAIGQSTLDLSAQYPYTGGAVNVAPTAGGVADGILDVGTTIAGGSGSTNWFAAVGPVGSSFGNGTSTLPIGEFVLTLGAGDLLSGGTTQIGYFLRPSVGGTPTTKNYNTGQLNATNFTYNYQGNIALATAGTQTTVNAYGAMVGAGVTILAVPEPSAFGMLAIGALGLVGFRRMGLRRNA